MESTISTRDFDDVFLGDRRLALVETLNQLTHGLGLLLSFAAAVTLVAGAANVDDVWRFWSALIYGTSLVAMYAASTLSHSFRFRPRAREFFRVVDQVCIFFLIAGTYTPFGLIYLRTGSMAWLTTAMWTLAIAGALFKICFSYLKTLNLLAYLALGWLPMLAAPHVMHLAPQSALLLMAAGGLLYTLGTLFLALDTRYPYFHAVWHTLVVSASALHFVAIYQCILG